jgi:hypothetical protein
MSKKAAVQSTTNVGALALSSILLLTGSRNIDTRRKSPRWCVPLVEIQLVPELAQMFVFGEVQDPNPETVNLVEDIVRSQIIELVSRPKPHRSHQAEPRPDHPGACPCE